MEYTLHVHTPVHHMQIVYILFLSCLFDVRQDSEEMKMKVDQMEMKMKVDQTEMKVKQTEMKMKVDQT